MANRGLFGLPCPPLELAPTRGVFQPLPGRSSTWYPAWAGFSLLL